MNLVTVGALEGARVLELEKKSEVGFGEKYPYSSRAVGSFEGTSSKQRKNKHMEHLNGW